MPHCKYPEDTQRKTCISNDTYLKINSLETYFLINKIVIMLACEKEKLVGVKNYCKDQETTPQEKGCYHMSILIYSLYNLYLHYRDIYFPASYKSQKVLKKFTCRFHFSLLKVVFSIKE